MDSVYRLPISGLNFRLYTTLTSGDTAIDGGETEPNGKLTFYYLKPNRTYRLVEEGGPYDNLGETAHVIAVNGEKLNPTVPLKNFTFDPSNYGINANHNELSITITNDPVATIEFYKVRSDNTNVYLNGAKFRLTKNTTTEDPDAYEAESTSKNGGAVTFVDIPIGPSGSEYTLEEIAAPSNYIRNAAVYTVTVNRNRTYTIKNSQGNIVFDSAASYPDRWKVKNAPVSVSESSDDSNDSGSSYTPSWNVTTDKQPNLPKTATLTYSGSVKDGRLTFTVTKAMVQAALDKAGTDPDGIALIFKISNTSGYNYLTANISEDALALLKSSGAKYVQFDSVIAHFRFDSKAITQIDSQTTGQVSVHVNLAKLNEAAKKLIGSRPFFDIAVQFKKSGTTYNVTDLGSGRMTRWIAYKPASGENSGNLTAVYVDKNGVPSWIEDSVYDNGWVSWTSGKLSVYGVGYKTSAPTFTDTANHWAKDYIDFAVSRDLISGTSTTAFSPDAAMTRAVVFLSALGKLSVADVSGYTTSSFTDVSNTDSAMPYIEWAVANKIVSGVGDNKFAPDSTITREQMAVMMVNYAKTLNYTLSVTVEAYRYTDAASINTYAKDAVTAVQQAGIIVGKGGGVFDPQGKATRAEGSTILQNFVELVIDPASARGWVQNDSGGWMYYGLSTGKLFTGWQDISSNRYYFDKNGVMQAEKWLQIDSKWYYFQTDGSLAVDTKIDGYEVGADGVRK